MTSNLDPVLNFIVLDAEQAPVLNEQGLPTLKQAPITKSIADLVNKGKVKNIEMFAQLESEAEQWQWAKDYCYYIAELQVVNEHNENLDEPIDNEDGTQTIDEPWPLPVEPVRPSVKTAEQILEPYQRKIAKLRGIDCKGVFVSLTESNQNGLSALKSALELAKEFEVDDQFFPVKFNADTCDGVQVLVLADEAEFKQFGLSFILARKAFFE